MSHLGIPYDYVEKNIIRGETRTPEFLAINPNGRVPVLELEPGVCLPESNAILIYLSEGTAFLPADRLERALVMQWLFFEQYSHEPNIATPRFILTYLQKGDEYRDVLEKKRELGYAALGVMEKRLAEHPFLVGDRYTIADIALYAYTHVADEGGFSLEAYPGIRAWIDRIQAQPNYVAILP